jgi:hypothetical protein
MRGRTSTRIAGGVTTTLAPHGHGRSDVRWWEDTPQAARPAVADPWWDDAPVPPPVVVASADGRTPAITFAPDADPFSAGGLFAPAGARDGEPSVVVHAAPDAGIARTSRRTRPATPPAAGSGGSDTAALRAPDPLLDTGSMVRPYVPAVPADADADSAPTSVVDVDALSAAISDATGPVAEPLRRVRRAGGPLDRVVEAPPTPPSIPLPPQVVGDWSAPWSRDGEGEQPSRSLFEPTARREPDGIWAAPRDQALPSRKAIRAKERAAGEVAGLPGITGKELAGRTTGRRLAKSGVLAVTAIGVVAASAPNAFPALGWRVPAQPGTQGQAALAGLADADTLAAVPLLATPSGSGNEFGVGLRDLSAQRKADDALAARAGAAATGAGRSLVDLARRQVVAEAARKQAIAVRTSRNVVRDPRAYARLLVQQRGWSASQFTCLNLLWNRESGWNYRAMNPSSGAYGIPQALPGSKMGSIAPDWRTNPATQIKWGLNYIAERYGTPCGAWGHSESVGWY